MNKFFYFPYSCFLGLVNPPKNNHPPQCLFILVDDLGWKDLSCYGSSFYETPNIDRLADMGFRFSQPILRILFVPPHVLPS